MTGPSSSHTAGAVRLGRLAAAILGAEVSEASMEMHGSFASTGQGHGTRQALVAGLMGWKDDDRRIPESFAYASQAGLAFEFIMTDLGESAHPNSVRFRLVGKNGETLTTTGCSIGGGRVRIVEVNGISVDIAGELPTLLTFHYDRAGVVAGITRVLAEHGINVATMSVYRKRKGEIAVMVVGTDQPAEEAELQTIEQFDHVIAVRNLSS